MIAVPAITATPDGNFPATLSWANAVRTAINALIISVNNDAAYSTTVSIAIALKQNITVPLTALSTITPSTDTLSYFTSTTVAAVTALTAFARTVIGAVDAPTMRGLLSINTAALQPASAFDAAGLAAAAQAAALAVSTAQGLFPTTTKTANYTAIAGDFVMVDATSAPITITAPTLAAGVRWGIRLITASPNVVTALTGTGTFDTNGTTTMALAIGFAFVDVVFVGNSAGTQWVASSSGKPNAYIQSISNPTGIVASIFPTTLAGVNVAIGTANRAVFYRVMNGAVITKMRFAVGVQSGNISVGIYTNTGVGLLARPGALVASTGSIVCPAVGQAEVALGATVQILPGNWLAISASSATAQFLAAGVTNAVGATYDGHGAFQDTAHPLPATAAATSGSIGPILLVCS